MLTPMQPRATIRLALLGLSLSAGGGWLARAADPPPEPVVKQVAAGTADMLKPAQPETRVFPLWLAKRIEERTALFYFAPTCPHCQDAIPGVNQLIDDGYLKWLGISTTSATQMEIASFETDYRPQFDIIQDDEERAFSRAVDARSTPSVFVVAPPDPKSDAEPGTLVLIEQYPPWPRGIEGLFRIRQHTDDPFRDFDTYVGMRTCMGCHTQEAQSWALTHHAVAYRTLWMRDRAQDLQCVGCHVTGLDHPDGVEETDVELVVGVSEGESLDVGAGHVGD